MKNLYGLNLWKWGGSAGTYVSWRRIYWHGHWTPFIYFHWIDLGPIQYQRPPEIVKVGDDLTLTIW